MVQEANTILRFDSRSHDLTMHGLLKKTKKSGPVFFSGSHGGPRKAVAQLKGTLKSQAGKPLQAFVSVIDLDQGVECRSKFLREDGTFDFSLINKRTIY